MKKTVFFGPFVGEFGWEITYWHGWVRKMCQTKFKDYHKVVCSFEGHHLFYPDADEFIPHKLNNLPSRSYITDSWVNGYPKAQGETEKDNYYQIVRERTNEIQAKLPKDMQCFYPWSLHYKDRFYGVEFTPDSRSDDDFAVHRIPPEHQIFEKLKPSKKGLQLLDRLTKKKLITIFPRKRLTRRPDKNWDSWNYLTLIKELQEKFPQYDIAIVGTPNGAYFADGMPKDCIDLINVEEKYRMDYETAALSRSVLTIGSISGAILYALICGSPSLTWGYGGAYKKLVKEENPLNTRLVYYPVEQPTPDEIYNYAYWMLTGDNKPTKQEAIRLGKLAAFGIAPSTVLQSKNLAKIKGNLSTKWKSTQ